MNRRHFIGSALAALASSGCATPSQRPRQVVDPLKTDAVGQAALVESGAITALELAEAVVARARRFNPGINAIVGETYDAALSRARSRKLPGGPLQGVPFAIKDLTDVAGLPTSKGSRWASNARAKVSAPLVDANLAAGLNIIGKTNTPEFGLISTTESLALGPCRNPWNLDYSSGGSSGGAAAAVAAGILTAAHAGDGGGSIRIPASCCGLVGLKPSRGRMYGAQNDIDVLRLGVSLSITRSVRDMAVLLALGEGHGGRSGFAPVGVVSPNPARKLRIAFSTRSAKGTDPVADVIAAQQATARLCESLGHEVIEASPQYDGLVFEDRFIDLWASGAAKIRSGVLATGIQESRLSDLLEPWTLFLAERALAAPPGTIERVREHFIHVQAVVNQFMAGIDVWLTPVVTAPAPRIGEQGPLVPPQELYRRVFDWIAYTPLANAIGTPAISLPLGFSQDGLPIGSMFMAKAGDEQTLLELAYQLETAQPWFDKRPEAFA